MCCKFALSLLILWHLKWNIACAQSSKHELFWSAGVSYPPIFYQITRSNFSFLTTWSFWSTFAVMSPRLFKELGSFKNSCCHGSNKQTNKNLQILSNDTYLGTKRDPALSCYLSVQSKNCSFTSFRQKLELRCCVIFLIPIY